MEQPAVYVALECLLEHQPPQVRLVIGPRHDPPVRLARLAARRQLAELRRLYCVIAIDPERMELVDQRKGWGARETLDL